MDAMDAVDAVHAMDAMDLGGTGYGVTPGRVDVRLLVMTPRLDGGAEALPANRARRAVELVAYLALHTLSHHQRPVAYPGAGVVGRGRRIEDALQRGPRRSARLGHRRDGQPLFPAGNRNGLYSMSSEVTVDVQRASAFVRQGKAHADSDPEHGHGHFGPPLELVEGEPLANALSGYTWWETEGHGGRIAAILVDAGMHLDRTGVAQRDARVGPVGRGAGPPGRALQRGAVTSGVGSGRCRRRCRSAPERVARLPAPESTRSIRAARPRRAPEALRRPAPGDAARRPVPSAGRYAPALGD